MILKVKKIFWTMFKVTEYAALIVYTYLQELQVNWP